MSAMAAAAWTGSSDLEPLRVRRPRRRAGPVLLGAGVAATAFSVGLYVGNHRAAPAAGAVVQMAGCSAAVLKCHDLAGGKISCVCDGRPLGAGTAHDVSTYYPYGNNSLASIYDTEAYMHDALVPLTRFRSKAILIGNTASN